jgi:hypothetical protein
LCEEHCAEQSSNDGIDQIKLLPQKWQASAAHIPLNTKWHAAMTSPKKATAM